jgi:hypothetical protein
MKVFTGYLQPPGRGSHLEASAEYLAEDRNMAEIERLLEPDGFRITSTSHRCRGGARAGPCISGVGLSRA